MGKARSQLIRLKEQYDLYTYQRNKYNQTFNKGNKASIFRWLIFQKNKLSSLMGRIASEMQPRLWKIGLSFSDSTTGYLLVASEDKEDALLYLEYWAKVNNKAYKIIDIQELSTFVVKE